jgi:hypothetical protein
MGTFLTKGTTFITGDTVTAASLNNLVDNATVTAGSIGSTELGTNSVTADKISTVSPQPVTTSTIRNNAVDNTKLNNMGSQTVKVNATPGSADPADLGMIGGESNGTAKILMGTSNSLSVLTAGQFKMVDSASTPTAYADATDSTATHLRLNTTVISDWDTVALATDVDDDADRLLFWDYDPLSLKQISPKKLIQSLPATTATTGVVKIATGTELSNPFDSTHYTELALSPKGSINCPIFAKAVLELTTELDGSPAATGKTSIAATYNFGAELTSGTLLDTVRYYIVEYKSGDNFEASGASANETGIEFDANTTSPTWTNGSRLVASPVFEVGGKLDLVFSNNLGHARFMVMCTANYDNSAGTDWRYTNTFKASSQAITGFTINFGTFNDGMTEPRTPRNIQILVF